MGTVTELVYFIVTDVLIMISAKGRNSMWRLIPFAALLAAVGVPILHGQAYAQLSAEHPYIEASKIRVETCLSCHAEKKAGKFVHSAVEAGCQACHQVVSEKETEKTRITLLAKGGKLCRRCHETKLQQVVHGPYESGHCTICHEPHSSRFPAELRADQDTLCDSCHEGNQSSVQIDVDAQEVTLIGRQKYPLAAFKKAPKLGVLHPAPGGPISTHPIVGRDPREGEILLRCTTCHDPHASEYETLLRKPARGSAVTENLCLNCHSEISLQFNREVQHPAIAMGCLTCHAVHTPQPADKPQGVFHLIQPEPNLCLKCHTASDETMQGSHSGRPSSTKRCTGCHNPHGSHRAS